MLPVDDKARKALPVFTGVVMYFPDALAAVAEVSRIGNEQHNPGEPLHWARGKSMNQEDTALRHMMDHGRGVRYDTDRARHLAKAAWRILAALQLDIEQERADGQANSESPQRDPHEVIRGAGSQLPHRRQVPREECIVAGLPEWKPGVESAGTGSRPQEVSDDWQQW